MKQKIFFLMLLLMFLPLIHAEVQSLPHPVKTYSCTNLPQLYANSTNQNISTVQLPDETVLNISIKMSNQGNGYFNYTFCNTTLNGNYIVNGIGDVDGIKTAWNYKFIVNPLGQIFTTQQALLYLSALVIAFVFFLITLTFGIYAPSSNKRDQMTGYIIAVENMKYVKYFMLAVSYLLLMLIFYFGYMISYAYLDLPFLGNLFNIAWIVMAWSLVILFPITIYLLISNAIQDHKIDEMIQRGFKVR